MFGQAVGNTVQLLLWWLAVGVVASLICLGMGMITFVVVESIVRRIREWWFRRRVK